MYQQCVCVFSVTWTAVTYPNLSHFLFVRVWFQWDEKSSPTRGFQSFVLTCTVLELPLLPLLLWFYSSLFNCFKLIIHFCLVCVCLLECASVFGLYYFWVVSNTRAWNGEHIPTDHKKKPLWCHTLGSWPKVWISTQTHVYVFHSPT